MPAPYLKLEKEYQEGLITKREVEKDMILRPERKRKGPHLNARYYLNLSTKEPEPLKYKLQDLPGRQFKLRKS